jgi:predicted ester cyclase
LGIPPTDRQISVTGIAIERFENGKSVEHWEIFDQLGMMQQLGVIPPPGQGGD